MRAWVLHHSLHAGWVRSIRSPVRQNRCLGDAAEDLREELNVRREVDGTAGVSSVSVG